MVLQLDFATSPFLEVIIMSQIVLAMIIKMDRISIIKGIRMAKTLRKANGCGSVGEGFCGLKLCTIKARAKIPN